MEEPIDDPEFELFWLAYPRRIGKGRARKSFNRAREKKILPAIDALIAIVVRHTKQVQWANDGGEYIPHPATWLNGEQWLDELPAETNNEREEKIWKQLTDQYRREGL